MEDFYFTFGKDHEYPDGYVIMTAEDELAARIKMVKKYSSKWAFCYTKDKFEDIREKYNLHEVKEKENEKENSSI